MRKSVIFIQILVLALFLSGCSKREADIDIDGQVEYMPYESVESAQFSFYYGISDATMYMPEVIYKDEHENDLKKLYNVLVNSTDIPDDDYEGTVYYSGRKLQSLRIIFEVLKKDAENDKWLDETERITIWWYTDTGKLDIYMPSYYDTENEEYYREKYIDSQSADVLEEIFVKYLSKAS